MARTVQTSRMSGMCTGKHKNNAYTLRYTTSLLRGFTDSLAVIAPAIRKGLVLVLWMGGWQDGWMAVWFDGSSLRAFRIPSLFKFSQYFNLVCRKNVIANAPYRYRSCGARNLIASCGHLDTAGGGLVAAREKSNLIGKTVIKTNLFYLSIIGQILRPSELTKIGCKQIYPI